MPAQAQKAPLEEQPDMVVSPRDKRVSSATAEKTEHRAKSKHGAFWRLGTHCRAVQAYSVGLSVAHNTLGVKPNVQERVGTVQWD
jgi:hypothetical protein